MFIISTFRKLKQEDYCRLVAPLDDIESDPVLRKIKKRKKSILSELKMGGLCISGHYGLNNGVKITIRMVFHWISTIISKLPGVV